MKTFEASAAGKLSAMEEEGEDGCDDDDNSSSSRQQNHGPTSNLVAPGSLKRRETAAAQGRDSMDSVRPLFGTVLGPLFSRALIWQQQSTLYVYHSFIWVL